MKQAQTSGGDAGWIARARPLIERLEALEGQEEPAAYAHHAAWLVRPDYLPVALRYGLLPTRRRLPGLHRAKALGLAARWLSPLARPVRLRSAAEAIQLSDDGERLRALYLGARPRSLKLTALGRRQEMRPDQEATLRRQVAALGTLRVPTVYDSRVEDGLAVVEEELLYGRRLLVRYDQGLIRRVLAPALLATYRAAGLEWQPLAPRLAGLPQRLPDGRLREAVVRLLARDPEAAVSFCHRDLSPSNIVVAGREVVVLDWENAGEGIAAFDLLALALRYPRNRALFSTLSSAVDAELTGRGARLEELLLLALAERVARAPSALRRMPRWLLERALTG